MRLFEQPFNLIERSLDVSALRHKVIANNVANVDTMNYKRSEVIFEKLLQQELNHAGGKKLNVSTTHERHFTSGHLRRGQIEPEIHTDNVTSMNNNGNNVDIDLEMALLAKNQIVYNTLIQQMNHHFNQIRTAIGGK